MGDDLVQSQWWCDRLSQWSLSTIPCASGKTLVRELRRVKEARAEYDLVLLSAGVLEEMGREWVQQIENDPTIGKVPVILVAAADDNPEPSEPSTDWIRHRLLSSVSMTELRVAIESILNSRKKRDSVLPDKPGTDSVDFDRDAMLQNTGGDRVFVRKLIEMFQIESRRQLSAIADAVEARDGQMIKSAAHVFKGSVALFGASGCIEEVLRLEKMGERNELRHVETQFQVVCRMTAGLSNALNDYLAEEHTE
ncbi:response regulator [Novipirellula caenicola]|uniref:response regulator n=1 Tax=Novipirellula caenicola TaxID=1536901 RepID=UPI0031E60A95